jgi:hypothetical protein
MTRTARTLLVAAVAVLALGSGLAVRAASGTATPETPVPRVCWFSDYEHAKLSNKCTYREESRRWYMEVDGRQVPADEQQLPVANLCLYFHGTRCPER